MLPAQIELRKFASSIKGESSSQFFKTGPGEYGEGDLFLGITVPIVRKIAMQFAELELNEIQIILSSPFHEDRLLALLILEHKFSKANNLQQKEQIINFYLKYKNGINNWDLVDLTASKILGSYCFHNRDKGDKILIKLSESKRHWDRRIAMIATLYYIKNQKFDLTLKFAELNLKETEDLMHKATGWMLREMGKKNLKVLKLFIDKFGHKMPRTMLRYSIEKFSIRERKSILLKTKKTRGSSGNKH